MPIEMRISRLGDADPLAVAAGTPRMHGAGGMAGKRFGAAEAHRELDDLQLVEEPRTPPCAPPFTSNENVVPARAALRLRKPPCRARPRAARPGNRHARLSGAGEKHRHAFRVAAALRHAQRQRFQRAAEHPARMRVELRADRAAQLPDRPQRLAEPSAAPATRSRMPADILGERIDDDVGAVLQRLLEDRAEQRVVATMTGGRVCCARPISSATRRTSARSTRLLSGFDGVSTNIAGTRPWRSGVARPPPITSASLMPSTKPCALTPYGGSVCASKVSVPP